MTTTILWGVSICAALFLLCGCESINTKNMILLNKDDDEYDLRKEPKRLKLLDFEGKLKKKNSETALMQAVIEGQMDIVKLLLEKGADINAKDNDKWTALIWAIHYDHLKIAELLIEQGADVNIKTKKGQTALSMTIQNNHIGLAEKLITKGAEVNIKTKDSPSLLSMAIKTRHQELAKLMLENRICLMGSPRSSRFPLVIAHRGDSANFPENSLAAFKGALKSKADMIELDIHLTKDNTIIVCHDAALERTTDGKGKIWEYSLEELKDLDAGSWFDPKFKGTKLASLEEVFKTFGNKILFNVEVKGDIPLNLRPNLIKELLNLIAEYNLYSSVIVSSSNYQILKDLRQLDKKLLLGVIGDGRDTNINKVDLIKAVNACIYCPEWKYVDKKLVKELHKAGILVMPWSNLEDNTPENMEKMLKLGVEGFFANDPTVLKKLVDKYHQSPVK